MVSGAGREDAREGEAPAEPQSVARLKEGRGSRRAAIRRAAQGRARLPPSRNPSRGSREGEAPAEPQSVARLSGSFALPFLS